MMFCPTDSDVCVYVCADQAGYPSCITVRTHVMGVAMVLERPHL